MKKMPCLYARDEVTHQLTENITPGTAWVLNGEGVACRKFDGTACFYKDGELYKRFDAKQGKKPPEGWTPCQPEPDPGSGHWPGWVRVSPTKEEDRWFIQGMQLARVTNSKLWDPWTYELCGPKVGGNPENQAFHVLVAHGCVQYKDVPRDREGLRAWLTKMTWIEGIVFWRDFSDLDCEKVKVRRKDFGLAWPPIPVGGTFSGAE